MSNPIELEKIILNKQNSNDAIATTNFKNAQLKDQNNSPKSSKFVPLKGNIIKD